jgi:hypothetical protein
LTSLDSFRWGEGGYVKELVPQTKAHDVDELRRRLTAACEIYTADAAKHLARGAVSSGHLSDHQERTHGNLVRTIETLKLCASFSEVHMFLCVLVKKINVLLLVEILPDVILCYCVHQQDSTFNIRNNTQDRQWTRFSARSTIFHNFAFVI